MHGVASDPFPSSKVEQPKLIEGFFKATRIHVRDSAMTA